jgi:outer membrane protein TolC
VVNAYNSFLSADKKLKLFTGGLVRIAKEVLDEKREEYYNGDIHLIEVMDAQRSYDEILLSFYSTIYEKSQALVRLESAIGVWNIE